MTKKNRKSLLLAAALILVAAFALLVFTQGRAAPPPAHATGLFAWHRSALESDGRASLLEQLAANGIGELYQYLPGDVSAEDAAALLDACRSRGIRLFLLAGEPEWALERKAEHLLRELRRAKEFGFAGLVVDVEPYLLGSWKSERDAVLRSFLASLRRLKRAAERADLEIVLCVPYYWDEQLKPAQLKALVAGGCDTLAVMNYYRRREDLHLSGEAALCRKYRKALINIYELQRPGTHSLTEENTYYTAGLPAVWESWEALREAYPSLPFSCALHELEAWKELIELE